MHVFVHAKGQTKARPIGTVSDGASLIAFDYKTSVVTFPYRADGEAASPFSHSPFVKLAKFVVYIKNSVNLLNCELSTVNCEL